jgi:hypothetical protein
VTCAASTTSSASYLGMVAYGALAALEAIAIHLHLHTSLHVTSRCVLRQTGRGKQRERAALSPAMATSCGGRSQSGWFYFGCRMILQCHILARCQQQKKARMVQRQDVGGWGLAVWRYGGMAVWRCGGVAVWRCRARRLAVWRSVGS